MTVEELDLSSRTLNCLKRAGLNKVGEVMEKTKDELLDIRNFGEKSFNELYDKFRDMDVLPDHLDPDKIHSEDNDDIDGEEKQAE